MKTLAVLIVSLALAASGCSTVSSIDGAIQRSLPQICSAAATLHATFVAVSATGALPESAIRRESQAWGVLEPLCKDPSQATSTSVLVAAANAYATIARELRKAEEE